MNKKYFLFFIGLALMLNACKTTDTASPSAAPSSQQAEMEDVSDNAKDDLVDMVSSEGAVAVGSLSQFMSQDDPFSFRSANGKIDLKEFAKYKLARLKTLFIPKDKALRTASDDEHFVFSEHLGIYNWNPNSQDWDRIPSGNKIVMNFPSDSGINANDSKLTIYNFQDQGFDFTEEGSCEEEELTYLPTALTADLYIKGTKYADVAFSASYESNGIPVAINLTLYLKPYTYTLNYSKSGVKISADAAVRKDGEALPILATGATLEFMNGDFVDVRRTDGFVQYRAIKVDAHANVHALDQISESRDPNAAELNLYTDITLVNAVTNLKIGDIMFEDVEGGETEAYIYFIDGSKEKPEVYFQPLIDEIENYIEGELDM